MALTAAEETQFRDLIDPANQFSVLELTITLAASLTNSTAFEIDGGRYTTLQELQTFLLANFNPEVNTIENGTTAPGAAVGVDGDFFIDTANLVFYGPKAGGAWPAGVSLKGADGTTVAHPMIYETGTVSSDGQVQATGGAFIIHQNDRNGLGLPLGNVLSGSVVLIFDEADPTANYIQAALTGDLPSAGTIRSTGATIATQGTIADGANVRMLIQRAGVPGATGADGIDAIANNAATFVQPASDATVDVTVDSSAGLLVGQIYTHDSGNRYTITALPDANTLTARNDTAFSNPTGVGANVPAGRFALSGPTGPVGADGIDAIANNAATFVQPASDATVDVTVDSSAGIIPNQIYGHSSGEKYTITAIVDATTITVRNDAAFNNAIAPTNNVAAGTFAPSAANGADGAPGSPGITFIRADSTSPPTGNSDQIWIIEDLAKTAYWDPAANGGSGAWIDNSGNTL